MGIEDVFELDLGWTTDFDATNGAWELANPPIEVFDPYLGVRVTPSTDASSDVGKGCYVTENTNDLWGVRQGSAALHSPKFDLTLYQQPVISFYTWYINFNLNTGFPVDDPMIVRLSNGSETINLDTIFFTGTDMRISWKYHEHPLTEHIDLTDDMQVSFLISAAGSREIVEAGVDFFQIKEVEATSVLAPELVDYQMNITPNPSRNMFQLNYELPIGSQQKSIQVYNSIGQLVERLNLTADTKTIRFGEKYVPEIYLVQIATEQGLGEVLKVIRK